MSKTTSPATTPASDLTPVFLPAGSPNGTPHPNGSASPNGSPPGPTRPDKQRRSRRLGVVLVGGLLVVLAVIGGVVYSIPSGPKGPRSDLILYKVHYEPLNLTV